MKHGRSPVHQQNMPYHVIIKAQITCFLTLTYNLGTSIKVKNKHPATE